MFSFTFFLSSLIIVLLPGTGVLYTVNTALNFGFKKASLVVLGCTFGILPHLILSFFLLSFALNSQILFEFLRYIGALYLLYMAFNLFFSKNSTQAKKSSTLFLNAIFINLLNPKLFLFFLAFLPQFLDKNAFVLSFFVLSLSFMSLTLIVFLLYAIFAKLLRTYLLSQNNTVTFQRLLALFFLLFALDLLFMSQE